ncbi:MAG: hypothetical protein HQL20_10045 [Candidatus Omnitrophica bacterium]|nr:hypothetical protein [Candidatus Omnitrophota bacterium]
MFLNALKQTVLRKCISAFMTAGFLLYSILPPASAQTTTALMPAPGALVRESPPDNPLLLQGLKVYSDDPFRLDFIVDPGQQALTPEALKDKATRSIRYFLTALTIPRGDLWVNLSPFENNRIITDEFGQTEMGRDLLAQDYLLKQLAASMTHPDEPVGKRFWKKVYAEAYRLYGTIDIPVDAMNKVWVVPGTSGIYEDADKALIVESTLKVMLEEDYIAQQHNRASNSNAGESEPQTQKFDLQIMREIIIPEIQREVNEGANFAELRQIYNALILAKWYKEQLKDAVLQRYYINQRKTGGLDLAEKDARDKIFAQYLTAFNKGVFSFIREEIEVDSKDLIPRKYFSGGFNFIEDMPTTIYGRASRRITGLFRPVWSQLKNNAALIAVLLSPIIASAESLETPKPEPNATNNISVTAPARITAGERDLQAMINSINGTTLTTNEIVKLLNLVQAPGVTVVQVEYVKQMLTKVKDILDTDRPLLTKTISTLLALKKYPHPNVKSDVEFMLSMLRISYRGEYNSAILDFEHNSLRIKGETLAQGLSIPQKTLAAYIADPVAHRAEIEKFSGLLETLRQPEAANLLIKLAPGENSTMLDILNALGVENWESYGAQGVRAKGANNQILWTYSKNTAPMNDSIFNWFNGSILSVLLSLWGMALIDLLPKTKNKLKVLPPALEPGYQVVGDPEPGTEIIEIDPVLQDEAWITQRIKNMETKDIEKIENKLTREAIERIQRGKSIGTKFRSNDDFYRVWKYLERRNYALKGWKTRRERQTRKTAERQQFADMLVSVAPVIQPSARQFFETLMQAAAASQKRYPDGVLKRINPDDTIPNYFERLFNAMIKQNYRLDENSLSTGGSLIYDERNPPLWDGEIIYKENVPYLRVKTARHGTAELLLTQNSANLLELYNRYPDSQNGIQNLDNDYLYSKKPARSPLEMRGLILAAIFKVEALNSDNSASKDKVGGIDLTEDLLTTATTGQGVALKFKPGALEKIGARLKGFSPGVISIKGVNAIEYFGLPE